MSLKKEIPYFYTLMWSFGDCLVRTFKDREEFKLEDLIKSFINTNSSSKHKNEKGQMEKLLGKVCKLFCQNSVFTLPDLAVSQKIKTKKLKRPSTREELHKETGFIKQRISTVLSIYKAIDLVTEDNSTHSIKWNSYQAKVITDSQKYIKHLIKLWNQKRLFAKKLLQVLTKFETKVQNDQFNQNV
ncbi:hypothetical protein M0812_28246 [Anaeramoeba flamelloides]|uniref:Uncharacterized protein n=1 Tax=Anaeramoeba flamelloides TaxID=1746091 RepID=A0AAV7YCE8_9EUKA|nr:hypothetical protein M0812_28246 [Anaeramoeba flamelloides]